MPPVNTHQLPLFDGDPPADAGLPTTDRRCANCPRPLMARDRHYHSRRPNNGAGGRFVELICCWCAVNVQMAHCRIAEAAQA